MRKDNIYEINTYRGLSGKEDSDLSEVADYGVITKRIDALEESLTGKFDILVSKSDIRVDRKRPISLGASSFISGIAFVMMILAVQGVVAIGWQFWAAILFASSGLAFASLLILIGVDHDEYEED